MSQSRRQFLATAGGVCGALVGGYAFLVEPSEVLVSRHEVPIPGLAPSLDGIRLAQVTDVHFPGNVGAAQAALAHLKRERPEIVVMTGDMTERAEGLAMVAAFVAEARGSVATVATLGNWEYYSGAASHAADVYRRAGAELLVNSHREILIGGGSLVVVGLDDPVLGRPNVRLARDGQSPDSPEIWLVHAPGIVSRWHEDRASIPAFVLSGHTHGGQIRLPLLPAVTPAGSGRFVEGWYRDTVAPLYVSRGVGTTAVRARLRCPPELPIFTLRRA
ncbi:MAG: metallophosphoesterase [Gemmatimonadales bacterium]